ncbi:MAG: peptidylprolyl isomerase, partial [Chitinophagaceae bacterium]
MKKNWLAAAIISCITIPAASQTLFTYGGHSVEASEFLRTFNKSVPPPVSNRAAAIRDYLNLYINSRLKILEAYNRGYDTLDQVKQELENLRNQVIENYLSDPQVIDRLAGEAFRRSLKDIHAAHIFIAVNGADTAAGRRKLDEAMNRLQKGEDFQAVAQQLSDDPSARENKGDLYYITVFTLPYELENIVYATAPGAWSQPYRSKAGYHLFKNLGERKAAGNIKIQQLLIAFPPGVDEAGRKQAAQLADSLYRRIAAGDDFGKLAAAFSNDYISAASNGNVSDIATGQLDPAFEKAIWALPVNKVSPPIRSAYGYHIVKRIGSTPVVTDPANPDNLETLKQKVMADDRWKSAKDFIYTRIAQHRIYQPVSYSEPALWALTDSLLQQQPVSGSTLTSQSILFRLAGHAFSVADWISYAQTNRYKPGTQILLSYPELMDGFVKNAMYQYYRDHLADFNEEFRNQMNEFREGNLFFEIMQREVWDKVQSDQAALLALYEKNRSTYDWKPGADAIIFYCADEATAHSVAAQVR